MTIRDTVLDEYKKGYVQGEKKLRLPVVLTLSGNEMDLTLPVPVGAQNSPMTELFDYGLRALTSGDRRPAQGEHQGFLSLHTTIEDGDARRAIEALKKPPASLSKAGMEVYLIVDHADNVVPDHAKDVGQKSMDEVASGNDGKLQDAYPVKSIYALPTSPELPEYEKLGPRQKVLLYVSKRGGISSSVAKKLTELPNNKVSAMLSGMKKRNILIGKSMGIFEKGDNFNRNKNKSSAPKPHKQVKPYVSVSNAPHRETVNYKLMRIVAERKGSLDAAIALEMLAGDHSEKSIRFGLYALGKGGYLIHEKRGAPYNASEKARTSRQYASLFASSAAQDTSPDPAAPAKKQSQMDRLLSYLGEHRAVSSYEAGVFLERDTSHASALLSAAVKKGKAVHLEEGIYTRSGYEIQEAELERLRNEMKERERRHKTSIRQPDITDDKNLTKAPDIPAVDTAPIMPDALPTSTDELLGLIGRLYEKDPQIELLGSALRTIERPGTKRTATQMARLMGREERTEDVKELMKDLYYAGFANLEKGSYSLNTSGRLQRRERPAQVVRPEPDSAPAVVPDTSTPLTIDTQTSPRNMLIEDALRRYKDDARYARIERVLRRIDAEGASLTPKQLSFKLRIDESVVTGLLGELAQSGYLERSMSGGYSMPEEKVQNQRRPRSKDILKEPVRPMHGDVASKPYFNNLAVKITIPSAIAEKPAAVAKPAAAQPVTAEKVYTPDETDRSMLQAYAEAGANGIGRRVLTTHASQFGIAAQELVRRAEALKTSGYIKAAPDGTLRISEAGTSYLGVEQTIYSADTDAYGAAQRPVSYIDAVRGVFMRRERGEALGKPDIVRMAGLKDGEFEQAENHGMFVRRGQNYTLVTREWDTIQPKE